MMALALAGVVFAAAPQLAAPGLTAAGVPQEKADALNDYFAQQVSERGVRVVTRTEIAALIGAERQQQLLGCTEQGSCRAELAAALGVTGLITGSVAVVGDEWVVSLKVLAANGAREVAAFSARRPDERAALDFLTESAADLASQLGVKTPRSGRGWIIAAAFSGVLLVTGAVLMGLSRVDEAALRDGRGVTTYADVLRVRGRGETLQFTGVTLLAAAGAAGVAAAVLFGFARTDARATLIVLPGGAYAGIALPLP